MSNADATKEVSLTFSAAHNLEEGDIIYLDNVTVPTRCWFNRCSF
jgi:hypothetical protein